MRVSSYNIPTKVDDDKYMFLHGYTGAIDIIDAETAEFLINNQKLDTISEYGIDDETIEHLKNRGYLTERSIEDERKYVERMVKALHKRSLLSDANFTFLVTYNCNFRCPYCFEKHDGWSLKAHTMTHDCVNKAYAVIDKLIQERPNTSKSITLFGGEPLLKENLAIVEYIVQEGVKRGITFGAITNGYDVDNFVHLLSPQKIRSLQITLDGFNEIHNLKRPHRDGIPTFFKIIENIKLALKKKTRVAIRFNLDKTNQQESVILKSYFTEIGVMSDPNFSFSLARLINHDDSNERSSFFSQEEFNKLSVQPETADIGFQDYSIKSNLYNAISKGKPLRFRGTFCKSQITGYTFDPLYNIYPCWEVVGRTDCIIGNFMNGKIEWNSETRDSWHNIHGFTYPKCSKCPGVLLCGGGCPAKNRDSHQCIQILSIINNITKKVYQNINN